MDPTYADFLSSLALSELVQPLVLVAIGLTAYGVQRFMYPPAAPAPDGPHCAACYELDLEWTAPGCYRCPACGHEGGDGQAEQARVERQAAIHTWPRERQLAFAKQRWREADHALDEALAVLNTVGTGTALVEMVHTSTEGDWSDEAYFRGASLAQQAAEALADVATVHPGAPAFVVPFQDARPGDFGLETEIMPNGDILTDRMDLATVGDARAARAALAEQHETWLAWSQQVDASA